MFKNLRIGIKLAISFLAVGIVPVLIISFLSVQEASHSLSQQAFNQLQSVRALAQQRLQDYFFQQQQNTEMLVAMLNRQRADGFAKLAAVHSRLKGQVEQHLQRELNQLALLSQNSRVAAAITDLRALWDKDPGIDESSWQALEKRFSDWLAPYTGNSAYANLLLMDPTGTVVYSHDRRFEWSGKNIQTGALEHSGLGKAFSAGLAGVAIQDFQVEAASGDFFAFASAPVIQDGGIVGVLVLKLSKDPFNALVQRDEILGNSGETYLVGKHHGQMAFRSDMETMGEGRYKVGYPITTPYIEATLAGHSISEVYTDSAGKLVMVVGEPLTMAGLQWAIITKMDLEEVLAQVLEGEKQDFLAKYQDHYGFYDVFLIHPQGHVFYTVGKQSDYNTNLLTGPYRESGIAEAFRRVLDSQQLEFQDFTPYAPSNDEPAAFLAQPLINNNKVELVVAVQLPMEGINSIMQQRDGMGKTGEIYLVGSDYRMRSDSYLDPESHSVQASFAGTVEENGVDTVASREALAGRSDNQIVMDYKGHSVLSAYVPIELWDSRWALIADIDEHEAFAAVARLEWLMAGVVLASLVAIGVLAWLVTQPIVRPLAQAVKVSQRIAQGDLTATLEVHSRDQTGQLSQAMQNMAGELQRIVGQVLGVTHQVNSAARELAQSNTDLSQRTQDQAAALEETASSMEQLTSTVKTSADNATQASRLAINAREYAEQGGEVVGNTIKAMEAINQSSRRIADIIGTIDEIAFQTNLLALNAAVEAARAGDQGRGFAVVAAEVRKLAQRSAEAAKEIKGLINDSVTKVEEGSELVDASGQTLEDILAAVKKVSDIVAEMAAASQEQATGIEQVNKAISQMDQVVQQNAALVEETAASSQTMGNQSQTLKDLMAFFQLSHSFSTQPVAVATLSVPEVAEMNPQPGSSQHIKPSKMVADNNPVTTENEWETF